jgi:hypothetical protein
LARLTQEVSPERRQQLENERATLTVELKRLTDAIVRGGNAAALVEAIQQRETRLKEITVALDTITRQRATADAKQLRATLEQRAADWRTLLQRHREQGRQILRKLVVGRLTFEDRGDGYFAFAGKANLRNLLFDGLVHQVASPPGFEPGFWP